MIYLDQNSQAVRKGARLGFKSQKWQPRNLMALIVGYWQNYEWQFSIIIIDFSHSTQMQLH